MLRTATPAPAPIGVLSVMPPLTPAAYLQLRREAAGLSIDQVATALAPHFADRPAAASLIRLLETRGVRALHDRPLLSLRTVFRFDIDVYHQLADEPADRQPDVCRACGGSFWDSAEASCGCRVDVSVLQ